MQAADADKHGDKAEELVTAAHAADEEAKAVVKAAEEAEPPSNKIHLLSCAGFHPYPLKVVCSVALVGPRRLCIQS
jgi:hypothetical protein